MSPGSGARSVVRQDVDELSPVARPELDRAVGRGEQRVVAALAHVEAGVELGAALAHEDRAGGDGGAVEGIDKLDTTYNLRLGYAW